MTGLRHAALRQLALNVLAERTGSAAGSEVLAAATRRTYDDLARVSSLLIGQVGIDALAARAVHLAQQEHPWLADSSRPQRRNDPFAGVVVGVAGQDPAVATEGAAAVFAMLAGLLITFIGEPLTAGVLRKAWPEAFPDVQSEEP
jgi:hypothetical protein